MAKEKLRDVAGGPVDGATEEEEDGGHSDDDVVVYDPSFCRHIIRRNTNLLRENRIYREREKKREEKEKEVLLAPVRCDSIPQLEYMYITRGLVVEKNNNDLYEYRFYCEVCDIYLCDGKWYNISTEWQATKKINRSHFFRSGNQHWFNIHAKHKEHRTQRAKDA